MAFSKSIFISYCDIDKHIATQLRSFLETLLDEEVWFKDFDLNSGELIFEAITEAITEANWFIILISAASLQSQWVEAEANLATIRSMEDENFKIIIIMVDKTKWPEHIRFAFSGKIIIDLSEVKDIEKEFYRIIDYIESSSITSTKKIYVDRGEDIDRFSLLARRNKIIFILGWAGIGKTSFVTSSVSQKFHKRPLSLRITKGHSADLLARQIIQKAHVRQPIGLTTLCDKEWINIALDALKQRQDNFFLFLDNAEDSLAPDNKLLPYLGLFLESFVKADIETHIILATTRIPDYSASIGSTTDILKLSGLKDIYIKETIDLWLEGTERHQLSLRSPMIKEIVALIGGHPLAAKMIASYLKVNQPDEIISERYKQRFQLKLAEYVLRSTTKNVLTKLQLLILHILAIAHEQVTLHDMLSIKEICNYGIEDVHKAIWELTDLFLIEHDGEMMSLHNFLEAYYREQISQKKEILEKLSSQYGHYAYTKALRINNELYQFLDKGGSAEDDIAIRLSNEIFRYVLPAGRLLRSVDQERLADELPIQIKGTLRAMAFYFYQEKRDYKKALNYIDKWIEINPNDDEIMLYQARCFRNIRGKENLLKADNIISKLQTKYKKGYFAARLFREKAIIAEINGFREKAKSFFREGIESSKRNPYPENFIGLAQILTREIDEMPYWEDIRQNLAEEALQLLEKAREEYALFDRFHLGLYVEALIQAGQEDKAFPLLRETLNDRPEDERLNHKMAEILRKNEKYEEAETYALKAQRLGYQKAAFTLANIKYGQSIELIAAQKIDIAKEKLAEALRLLSNFEPSYGTDMEIVDALAAKIYRALNNWQNAKESVDKYKEPNNFYIVYEQCLIDIHEIEDAMAGERYGSALIIVKTAINRINKYASKKILKPLLIELLKNLQEKEVNIQSIIDN